MLYEEHICIYLLIQLVYNFILNMIECVIYLKRKAIRKSTRKKKMFFFCLRKNLLSSRVLKCFVDLCLKVYKRIQCGR